MTRSSATRRHRRRPRAFALALMGLFAAERAARADEVSKCVSAVEAAQAARQEGRLRAAREGFMVCARASCPGPIQTDCARWYAELEQGMPTVVVRAVWSDGRDAVGVRVFVDGVPLAGSDGRAVSVDPGEHAFRFEVAGARPVEAQYVIREGEKNRSIVVTFGPLATPKAPPAADAPNRTSEVHALAASDARAPVPSGAYVAAGIGAVAVTAFAVLAIAGTNELSTMRETCKPACAPSDVTAARTKLLVGDISLGVGVIALGTAAWLALDRHRVTAPRATIEPYAGPRDAGLRFETAF